MRTREASALAPTPADAPRVLLFHGLTGTPAELWPLSFALSHAGYRVETPLLPGHGTRPEALLDVGADEIVSFARRHARSGAPVVALGGLSLGALVALSVAADVSPRAMVLLAPAAVMIGSARTFDRLGRLPWGGAGRVLVPKAPPDFGDVVDEIDPAPVARAAIEAPVFDGASTRYARIPLRWSTELRAARDKARQAAARVQCPVLVAHGLQDRTASVESVAEVSRWLARAPVSVRLFPRSRHVLPLGAERGRLAVEVSRFLDAHLQAAPGRFESA